MSDIIINKINQNMNKWSPDTKGYIFNNLKVHYLTVSSLWRVSYFNNKFWDKLDEFNNKEEAIGYAKSFNPEDYELKYYKLNSYRRKNERKF